MAEAHDARELVEPQAAERDPDFFPLNDLPNDVLVSVFEAVGDLRWVRHTVPCVCRAWNELYCSRDASPLHETLEVNFFKEVVMVAEDGEYLEYMRGEEDEEENWSPPDPDSALSVHASRVIAWAERRAGDVRKLHLTRGFDGALEDFSAEDLGRLVAVVGPSLTDISFGPYFDELCTRPLWESLRNSVVPAGRLRSFDIRCYRADSFKSDLKPLLGKLAGSLEELVLKSAYTSTLSRIPKSFFALKKLRRLVLIGHQQMRAIPAGISSLKNLEELELVHCELSSLPRELVELSGLTKLNLDGNTRLRNLPEEFKTMKSLRELDLSGCTLSTVPAFFGELKSLEKLNLFSSDLSLLPKELGELSKLTKLELGGNENLGTTPEEAFPAELGKLKSLRELDLSHCGLRTVPAFVCKLESLKVLRLHSCRLSSLPKELGALSGLTELVLGGNKHLGTTLPAAEAFPAELGQMRSLRELYLESCGLRTVPAFIGGLESLDKLILCGCVDLQIDAPLDFLVEGCPRLKLVMISKASESTPESRAHLEAFKAKLRGLVWLC